MRRSVHRRLEATLARLGAEGGELGASVDTLLTAIDDAARVANERDETSRRSGVRLAQALDHIGQGVVICDASGDTVFQNAGATMVRAIGGDVLAEQAVSVQLEGALSGVSGEQTLELYSPHRRTLLIRAYPLRDLAPAEVEQDSGNPPGMTDSSLRFPSERVIGAVAVIDDVSERRRLEAVRRDFVANVSHELKTPVGALSLLAETLDGEDDPEIITRLSARVAAEAGRLGRIIDDLLDLSRIEANEAPAADLVPVHSLLGEAIEPLRSVARSHDIELFVMPVDPAPAVPGDRRDLVSAVANLVDNAIKYSEPGSRVAVDVEFGAGWVDIAVTDQGLGIPSRDLERIFERFYRVDRARSRLTGGTGLGLAIVRHVAANHGGSVGVRSVEGEGSTFTLRLPAVATGERRVAEGGHVGGS